VEGPLLLVREPLNEHDPNAIAVHIRQGHIGYVAKEYAAEIAPFLDSGAMHRASCRWLGEDHRGLPSVKAIAWVYPPGTQGALIYPQPDEAREALAKRNGTGSAPPAASGKGPLPSGTERAPSALRGGLVLIAVGLVVIAACVAIVR
jgi:hypothetical protein